MTAMQTAPLRRRLWCRCAAVVVRFDKNTALSRGWCTPLARGSAVFEQNASHNTQILALSWPAFLAN